MRLPGISSVAFKLAGATLALVALVTAGVSVQLERSQHEGLLRAKELSAGAVTRLFADSCAPAHSHSCGSPQRFGIPTFQEAFRVSSCDQHLAGKT